MAPSIQLRLISTYYREMVKLNISRLLSRSDFLKISAGIDLELHNIALNSTGLAL